MAIVYHKCMIPIHSRGNVHTINYDLGIRGICTEWQGKIKTFINNHRSSNVHI